MGVWKIGCLKALESDMVNLEERSGPGMAYSTTPNPEANGQFGGEEGGSPRRVRFHVASWVFPRARGANRVVVQCERGGTVLGSFVTVRRR